MLRVRYTPRPLILWSLAPRSTAHLLAGPHYQTGRVPGFVSLMPNQNGRFEVDYAITSIPQTTVMFACTGTDASVILADAIAFHSALGN